MIQANYILFISGAEIALILLIVVMVFGADKIPEIARGLAKGMKQIKSATNDIKYEITKTADKNGIDTNLASDFKRSVTDVRETFKDVTTKVGDQNIDVMKTMTDEADKARQTLKDITGSISRKR